jgi:hypothetical protein
MIDLTTYVGKPWEKSRDCWYWFRVVQRDIFGRDVHEALVNHSSWIAMLKSAADIMNSDIEKEFGWKKTDSPKTGDAVFLSMRRYAHHIGTVFIDNGKLCILHCVEGSGIVYDSRLAIKMHGWRIHGYWTPKRENE